MIYDLKRANLLGISEAESKSFFRFFLLHSRKIYSNGEKFIKIIKKISKIISNYYNLTTIRDNFTKETQNFQRRTPNYERE